MMMDQTTHTVNEKKKKKKNYFRTYLFLLILIIVGRILFFGIEFLQKENAKEKMIDRLII